jgi:hypothetical protein
MTGKGRRVLHQQLTGCRIEFRIAGPSREQRQPVALAIGPKPANRAARWSDPFSSNSSLSPVLTDALTNQSAGPAEWSSSSTANSLNLLA